MTKGAWWRKKKQNRKNDTKNNYDDNRNEKNNSSSPKYFINKGSLDNLETQPSTSNCNNNNDNNNTHSKVFYFNNSNIPNSFNFNSNNNTQKQLRWNGNKPNYLNMSKNHINPNKKETHEFEPKKPVNKAMTNRYFSIENKINEGSNGLEECNSNMEETEQTKDNNGEVENDKQQESEQFIKKRDYLIKRLLQSRNLPEFSTTDNQLTSNIESEEICLKIADDNGENKVQSGQIMSENINESANLKAKAPTTTPAFQEDFIPLFSTNKEKEKIATLKETQERNDDEDNDYEEIIVESFDHDEKDEEDVIDLTNNDEIIEVFNNVKKGNERNFNF